MTVQLPQEDRIERILRWSVIVAGTIFLLVLAKETKLLGVGVMNEIALIFFGTFIGLMASQLTEYIRRRIEQDHRRKRMIRALDLVVEEAEVGVSRCASLARLIRENKISYSRIYTAAWDSMRTELFQDFENQEVLKLLHRIHHRFDLVNFNMGIKYYDVGAGFAKSYIKEMEDNLSKLKAVLNSF